MVSTIDIISVGGTISTVVVGEGSVRHYELMSDDYVRLVFSSDKKINIRLGDKINVEGWGTFYITQKQKPTYNKTTGGYDYDLQFDAPYYRWNNKLYKYEPKNNRNEASWSLTDNLKNHMAVFLRNLAYYGWTYTVDPASYDLEEAQRTVFIDFQNRYLLDAISDIAEKFNVEWWITDNIIHFGKVESGNAVDFRLGDNVEDMSAENSEEDGVTRFYAFGATQNIPSGYRKSDDQVLLNGVVQKRLMLPKDTPYIDIESGLASDEIVEGIVTFDDVYPRTKSAVSEVIKVPKTVEKTNTTTEATTDTSATGTDTEAETEVVNIYRFKTKAFDFSADYILANTDLQVQFVSGKLNGMTFGVAFNPDGESETTVVDGKTVTNPDAQLFELVRNDTYGLMLPNDTLSPTAGDKFILLGWDANKLTAWQGLITQAEEELKTQLETYVKKKKVDPLTYVCTMMPDYMYGLDAQGNQDPNYTKVGSFPIGQKVKLYNDVYFKEGSRESRVIGYEYKLDIPYDTAQIYVGESPIYSTSKATQNAINEAASTVVSYRSNDYSNYGTGGNLFVIRSTDSITTPSETNVYSAKRSDLDFVHKRKDDRVSALWTFSRAHGAKRGIQSQDYNNAGNEGNFWGHGFELVEGPDSQGENKSRLEVDNLLVRVGSQIGAIKSGSFTSDDILGGKGYHMYTDNNGKSHIVTDYFTARIKAYFSEIEVQKITYSGGNRWMSAAGNTIDYVEEVTDSNGKGYKCWFLLDDDDTSSENLWKVGDQALCRAIGIKEGVTQDAQNRYYWRLVTEVGKGEKTFATNSGTSETKNMGYVVLSDATEPFFTIYADGDSSNTAETNVVKPDGSVVAFNGKDKDSDAPKRGDAIVQAGSQADRGRMKAVQIASTSLNGEPAPAINFYSGINTYTLPTTFCISPDGISGDVKFMNLTVKNDAGEPVQLLTFRGEWLSDCTYSNGDMVSYNGQSWIWNGPDPTTGTPPSEAGGWTLAAQKGGKGDDGTVYQVVLTADGGTIIRTGERTKTIRARVLENGADITSRLPAVAFDWTRRSGNDDADKIWNDAHKGAGSEITITDADVFSATQFDCVVSAEL